MFRISTIALATLCLTACYTPPSLEPTAQLSGNYVLDPQHTSVIWSVSHVGLSNYKARFDKVSGVLDFDAGALEASRLDISIDPASVSTGLPDFDETIAYESQYFDAETYPEIRFVSTGIDVTGEQTGTITGDLTFRGQTRPVILDVVFNGAGKSFGHPGETLGFSATGQINRSDFGLTTLKNFGIGEVVTLAIETEFNEAQ